MQIASSFSVSLSQLHSGINKFIDRESNKKKTNEKKITQAIIKRLKHKLYGATLNKKKKKNILILQRLLAPFLLQ